MWSRSASSRLREPPRVLGRPRGEDAGVLLAQLAVDAEADDVGEIVGAALAAQPLHHREIDRRHLGEPEPHPKLPLAEHVPEGAPQELLRTDFLVDVQLFAGALAGAPGAAGAAHRGMQGAGADVAPPDRHAEVDHALAEAFEQRLEIHAQQSLLHDPVGDRGHLGRAIQLAGRCALRYFCDLGFGHDGNDLSLALHVWRDDARAAPLAPGPRLG